MEHPLLFGFWQAKQALQGAIASRVEKDRLNGRAGCLGAPGDPFRKDGAVALSPGASQQDEDLFPFLHGMALLTGDSGQGVVFHIAGSNAK